MKKNLLLFVTALCVYLSAAAQQTDERAIRDVLEKQRTAWNKGDIETYMQGYWQNDSLMFIGKRGITYGWLGTLNSYKKGYPDADAMGTLDFTILQVKRVSADHFFVVGKWHLTLNAGNQEGHFSLLFRKVNGQWLIVADHSS